jgi:thiol-disulfide isomerase/thioredoxin
MNRQIKVFGKQGCPGCMIMSPLLMELFQEGFNIEFYAADDYHDLFLQEKIKAMPTIKFYNDGIMYSKIVGEAPKEEIRRIYNRDLGTPKSIYETRHEKEGW